jgi:hypothetical protein
MRDYHGEEHSISGAEEGRSNVTAFTNDFSLQYDRCDRPGAGANFVYATADQFGMWRSTSISDFSLTGPGPVACGEPTSIPEPGTAGLLLVGLTGVLMARRRRLEQTVHRTGDCDRHSRSSSA